jgi:predicted Zn-dependent peptidase
VYRIREYPNQAKLVYKKMKGVSSASLGLWLNTGSRNEDAKQNGISHFLEHLVFKGSKKYTGDAIKESIEGVGGSLNAFTSEENTCYYAKFLGKHLKKVLDVLSDMVLNPLLKEEDIEKERTVIIEEIKMYKDLPQHQVQEIFDGLFWPGHPLGRNIAGTIETVAGISRRQIFDYHKAWYSSSSLTISCAGALDEKILETFVEKTFGKLRFITPAAFVPFVPTEKGPRVRVVTKPIEQTHVNCGFPALHRSHQDRFTLGILHVILGGNMSSRLFNEVREKKGLAYEIGTHAKRLKDTGVFFVHAGIDNMKLIEASEVIFKELNRMKKEKVAENELRRAKDFIIGQSEMALDDSLEHMLWIGDSLISLGLLVTKEEMRRKIERVSSEDILRLAQELFDWNRLCFAAVGPQDHGDEEKIKGLVRDCCSSRHQNNLT